MSELRNVVNLFRLSNCPTFTDGRFTATIKFSNELIDVIKDILSKGVSAGSFNELVIDDEDIYSVDDIPSTGVEISYTFKTYQGSADRFYLNLPELMNTDTVKMGVMPQNFFIVEDNYAYFDAIEPSNISKVRKICELIEQLAKIAHYNDLRKDSNKSSYKLVFVLNSESKSSTAIIEPSLNEAMLKYNMVDISLIKSLNNTTINQEIHYIEKINTFRNTIIEYVSNTNNTFENIVCNWNSITSLFSNNLAVYMSAFSFHKSRKEVTAAEMEYAEKISKVVSDITNKALAIPISIVASIAVFQISGKLEAFIAFAGIILSAIITTLVAVSYKQQLERIIHAKDILFSSLNVSMEKEHSELIKQLNDAKAGLDKNEKFSRKTISFIMYLSWVPAYIGTLGLLIKLL